MTGEQGPPHKKRFTVTLKLGEEEYTSDEASIKKAQHSAAGEAITKTKYKHPPAKVNRLRSNGRNGATGKYLQTFCFLFCVFLNMCVFVFITIFSGIIDSR